jgi:Tol biopolymer transport system component
VFTELTGNYDVVSVDLEHAVGRRLIATERTEYMPAWAVRQPILVYVTSRNGPEEIWLHGPAGEDRPLVGTRDFPPGSTQWYVAPALSPDGDRVIYSRLDREGRSRLWISAVSGGSPVPLTNDEKSAESAGSWSYDSNWFAYLSIRNGKRELMKVKTTGQATPVLVKSPGGQEPPSWSPDGQWIVSGNELVSPDGSTSHPLGDHHSLNYAFSRDGKLLYGLRAEGERTILFSLDPATGSEKILGDLGADYAPAGSFHPGIRFSLSPDGKSIAFTSGRIKSNLWMLDGFARE